MSEQDAWAAGLFDGEGTVVVRCRGPRNLPCIQAKGSNPRWANPDGTCRQCGSPREQGQDCATCRRARYTRYNHRVRPPRSDRDCQEATA